MKYKQSGYKDEESNTERERWKEPRRKRDPDLPGGRLAEKQRVLRNLRCHHCGEAVPLDLDSRGDVIPVKRDAECRACGAAVHACRNCLHFATDAAFECRRKVKQAYPKGQANDCTEFEAKLAVEMTRDESRPTGSFGGATAERAPKTEGDARKAFDDLFK